jgi:hypothetical protein
MGDLAIMGHLVRGRLDGEAALSQSQSGNRPRLGTGHLFFYCKGVPDCDLLLHHDLARRSDADEEPRMEVLTRVFQSRRKLALLVFTLYASIATGLSEAQLPDAPSTMKKEASEWLAGQLVGLRAVLEAAQRSVTEFGNRAGLLELGGSKSMILTRLEQLNRQVSEAEANKITKQVAYDGQNLALVEVCSCRQNG